MKNGTVIDGSSGNTSIFRGEDVEAEVELVEGVNLKRARCLVSR